MPHFSTPERPTPEARKKMSEAATTFLGGKGDPAEGKPDLDARDPGKGDAAAARRAKAFARPSRNEDDVG